MVFEVNRDNAVQPGQISTGPRVGFLSSFDYAFDLQSRALNAQALEANFEDIEEERFNALQQLGVDRPFKSLRQVMAEEIEGVESVGAPRDGAFAAPLAVKYRGEQLDTMLGGERNDAKTAAIQKYNEQFAGLDLPVGFAPEDLSAQSILGEAQARGRQVYAEGQNMKTSTLGDVGFFFGSMFGYFDPSSANPLTFLTLPVGGFGRTAAGRILSQSAVQSGVEAAEQFTGTQEARQRLGLPTGFDQAMGDVLLAGAAGGALQGGIEGVRRALFGAAGPTPTLDAQRIAPLLSEKAAAALDRLGGVEGSLTPRMLQRRAGLDRDTANGVLDELTALGVAGRPRGFPRRRQFPFRVDPENPYGASRLAAERARQDLDIVQRQLGEPEQLPGVSGLRLGRLQGVRSGAATLPDATVPNLRNLYDSFVEGMKTPYDVAREVDPDLAARWEKLRTRQAKLQRGLRSLQGRRTQALAEAEASGDLSARTSEIARLRARMSELDGALAQATRKVQKQRIRRERETAEAQLRGLEASVDEIAPGSAAESRRLADPESPRGLEGRVRQELQVIDQKLRDLAPLWSRVLNAATDKWRQADPTFMDALRDISKFDPRRPLTPEQSAMLKAADDALAAERLRLFPPRPRVRTQAEVQEFGDQATLKQEAALSQASLNTALKAAQDAGSDEIVINGVALSRKDEFFIVDDDGTERAVKLEDAIEEVNKEDDIAGAFTTCRLS